MKISFSSSFRKEYRKLPNKLRNRVDERIVLFSKDPFNVLLHNHELKGKHKGYRSINITGDLRAHYYTLKKDSALFVKLGTHSELYS
ncbi:MAG: type II toxin-antitoxin system mRNA interferase toxin, RelE/StbE family [Candidatus Colwellbacteria bacterium]